MITFQPAQPSHKALILRWFHKPHAVEFWDTSPEMWQNVENYLKGQRNILDYWIAFWDNKPYGLVITSDAFEGMPKHFLPRPPRPVTQTIDFMIGEEDFLGKGLGTETLKAFFAFQPGVDVFFIDPQITNTKAVHVYEKVGFRKVSVFVPIQGVFRGKEHFGMEWVRKKSRQTRA